MQSLTCGGFVELPSGIKTELPWRLRYAHGAPTLHLKFTVRRLYPSKPFVHAITNLICLCFLHRSSTGVYFHPPPWRFRGPLTHCQPLRGERVSVQSACLVLDTERSKDQIIAMLVSDVVLLFTMLVGLLRLRKDGTLFGLGKLLWRQVSGAHSASLNAYTF